MNSLLLLIFGCAFAFDDIKTQQDVVNTTSKDERQDIMEDWENLMTDFLPDDMISFDLKKGHEEVVEEHIPYPTNVRGAYFISLMVKDKVDFIMKDPDGEIVTTKVQKKEAVFSVNVTKVGDYKFIFSNKRGSHDQTITFAIDVHNATYEHIRHQDLDPLSEKVQHLHSGLNDIMYETKFSQQRRESGYEQLQQTHQKLLYFTIFETLVIVGVSVWQVYYIKNIIDQRRLI